MEVWISEGYVPSQDGAAGPTLPLFSGKIQRDCRCESSWCAGRAACEWGGSSFSQRSSPCCFSRGNVSGKAGSEGSPSPICSSSAPDWQIGCVAPRSGGAIGASGLHMQMTWKWHKHVDTRIGFISAAGWRSQLRASSGHSAGISSSSYHLNDDARVPAHWAGF